MLIPPSLLCDAEGDLSERVLPCVLTRRWQQSTVLRVARVRLDDRLSALRNLDLSPAAAPPFSARRHTFHPHHGAAGGMKGLMVT